MAVKKHWSEILSCHLCGRRFKSMYAEAWHRHNARFVCAGYRKEEVKSNEPSNEQLDSTEPKTD